MRLLRTEMRRAVHRRVVWVLLGLALVGIAILGIAAFVDSAGKSEAELRVNGTHPAVMADWWVAGSADGILMIAAIPLLIGGLFGGASVAGAEWRAGTMTTVLTWEPRRLRLHFTRTSAVFLLATGIGFMLELLFLGATLPAVLTHGSTAGIDRGWVLALAAAIARIALGTGAAAALGVALATLGRSTTFALGAVFAWMVVGENLVRGLKPALQDLLVGENLAIVLTWAQLADAEFTRSAPVALAIVGAYIGIVGTVAAVAFARRDIAGRG